ncbi:nucleoside deaminase [Sinimarinibacterium sp. CAU 1509]|uniref:nucleoside deaminase n=1 Tax=Sinimarinibacterium sp. CAU 1509 TaxID=2562283 RepID=UPI0010AC5B3C|nr:nucleoside deaminase [Sinimarinibacterium sp. CAU 1509]TJY65078.1 nucleoside deaminase [Sinimarinibacterium sp. CAU 1509]
MPPPRPDADAHRAWLTRAIELGRSNLVSGDGGPFGAVIVMDGQVIGEGRNQVLQTHDPTAHAEVMALRQACTRLGRHQLPQAILYSSCEPCPMCLSAAYWAHIPRVYFAATRDDAAAAGFIDAELYALFEQRKRATMAIEQIDLPEARAALSAWIDSPLHQPY